MPASLASGIIGGICDVEILVIADVRAAQILVERLHGFFGADVAQNAVGLHGIAAAFGRADQFQLNEVAVFGRRGLRRERMRRRARAFLPSVLVTSSSVMSIGGISSSRSL